MDFETLEDSHLLGRVVFQKRCTIAFFGFANPRALQQNFFMIPAYGSLSNMGLQPFNY